MLYVSLIVATFLFFIISFLSILKLRIAKSLIASRSSGDKGDDFSFGDISKYYSMTMGFGFSLSLLITIMIFEWPSYPTKTIIEPAVLIDGFPIPIDIPITDHEIPEKPKVKIASLSPASEIEIQDLEPELMPLEELPKDYEEIAIDYNTMAEPVEEIVEDKIYDFAPVLAVPSQGWKEFYLDLSKNIKMSEEAVRAGIKGKVFIEFIIEKDGSLTNFKVQKGLGYGLEEEVIRALKEMPRFNPAYHGPRAVRFRMTLPVRFM